MDSRIGRRTWKKIVREKEMIAIALPFLPDEIIVNILSRLSVQMVIRCRLVCKRWRIITSLQDFVDLNFRHSSLPLIVVADSLLNLLDKWWEPPRVIHKLPIDRNLLDYGNFYSVVSQGGLIVYYEFKLSEVVSCIVNPIYPRENVRITLSDVLRTSKIYGVFFHPLLNEYCSLWKIRVSYEPWRNPDRIYYMMLTLGSHPSLKTVMVSNELLDRDKKPNTQFLLIGNYVYWMLVCEPDRLNGRNDVMKFDITTEDFFVMHSPVPLNTECSNKETHLLNIDGILSYLLVLPGKITIWRSKDDKEQLWTPNEYILNTEICICGLNCALAVVNGKFAFLLDSKLFICNLMEGTVKYSHKRNKYSSYLRFSHQMSLASLSNCKPTISIDQDQDNNVVLVEE